MSKKQTNTAGAASAEVKPCPRKKEQVRVGGLTVVKSGVAPLTKKSTESYEDEYNAG